VLKIIKNEQQQSEDR